MNNDNKFIEIHGEVVESINMQKTKQDKEKEEEQINHEKQDRLQNSN